MNGGMVNTLKQMNELEKEFVPYQESLELKGLGFDEPCFGFYLEDGTWTPASYSKKGTVYPSNTDLLPEWYTAPLFQQAFRWFRENYDLNYVIVKAESWFYTINGCNTQEGFNTYEEAELACLRKLIEIVKEKQS